MTLHLLKRRSAEPGGDLPGFLQGFRGGWMALVSGAQVLFALTGFLTPFLPLVLIVTLGARRFRHRRRARRQPGTVGPVPA